MPIVHSEQRLQWVFLRWPVMSSRDYKVLITRFVCLLDDLKRRISHCNWKQSNIWPTNINCKTTTKEILLQSNTSQSVFRKALCVISPIHQARTEKGSWWETRLWQCIEMAPQRDGSLKRGNSLNQNIYSCIYTKFFSKNTSFET